MLNWPISSNHIMAGLPKAQGLEGMSKTHLRALPIGYNTHENDRRIETPEKPGVLTSPGNPGHWRYVRTNTHAIKMNFSILFFPNML